MSTRYYGDRLYVPVSRLFIQILLISKILQTWRILFDEYLLGSELALETSLDLESVSEEYISFLCEDREDELVIVLESMREVVHCHDSVFDLFPEKRLLEEVVELDLVEFPDDKYIDNIVGCLIAKVEYRIRYRHKIESFSSFEKFFHGFHHII